MATISELRKDFTEVIENSPIKTTFALRKYIDTYSGADYDVGFPTATGNWISGETMVFPIKSDSAGTDSKYLEQGRINLNDSKMFLAGSINLILDSASGGRYKIEIPIGGSVFKILPEGIINYPSVGSPIFRKAYIRVLNNGSFLNEH